VGGGPSADAWMGAPLSAATTGMSAIAEVDTARDTPPIEPGG
jgi:hypothetical protein